MHAPDAEMALQNARDVYARRNEAINIWVVPSQHITASSPEDEGPFFDPANDKPYRHPQFYSVPNESSVLRSSGCSRCDWLQLPSSPRWKT